MSSRGARAHVQGLPANRVFSAHLTAGKPRPERWGHAGKCGPGKAVRPSLACANKAPKHCTEVKRRRGPHSGVEVWGGSGRIGVSLDKALAGGPGFLLANRKSREGGTWLSLKQGWFLLSHPGEGPLPVPRLQGPKREAWEMPLGRGGRRCRAGNVNSMRRPRCVRAGPSEGAWVLSRAILDCVNIFLRSKERVSIHWVRSHLKELRSICLGIKVKNSVQGAFQKNHFCSSNTAKLSFFFF